MASERELRDFVPFMAIVDGCVLSKRGDMTFGWKVWLPTAYTVNENGYDSIIRTFMQAYKLLPEWTVVHKQDIFCFDRFHAPEDEFFLADAYNRQKEGRTFLNGHCYLYVTFSTEGTIKRKDGESGFFGILDQKIPKRETIERNAAIASMFESVLKNNNLLRVIPLETEDFLRRGPDGRDEGVIADYLRLYANEGPDYNFETYRDNIRYGDRQVRVWYTQDSDAFPGQVSSVKYINSMSSGASRVFLSGGSPIGYNLRIPHVVNRYILVLPKGTVEKEIDMRKRLNVSFSLYSAECAVNAQEQEAYLLEAANNSTTTIKCFMNLIAWPTKDELTEVRNAIVTAFQSDLDVSVVEETRTVPLHHYAGIPSAAPELGYNNYMNSEITSFLCMGLWDGFDFGMKNGVIHLCDRSTMVPVTIDIQSIARQKGLTANQNALLVGPSGSGKSFTCNSLVQDFYQAGQHIMIIDVGDSYEGICAVVRETSGGKDGVYNTYDPEHPFSFNPFKGRAHWNEVDEEGERTSSGMDFLMSLIETIYKPVGGWSTTASSVLNFIVGQFLKWWDNGVPEKVTEDLKDAYANERRRRAERNKKKFDESKALSGWKDPVADIFREGRAGKDPVFDDFYQFVTRIIAPLLRDDNLWMGEVHVNQDMLNVEDFGAAMDMYKKGGTYGFLLNAEVESDLFESRLTVFEVDKIKDNKDLFPLWVICIMHSFEEKMRSLPCQKVMIIEEAWKAIATETMANFIVWMWRTARKFSTSAIVVTQDINDLIGSEIVKGAIIQNSDIRILLDQRQNANNFQRSVEVLGLSPMAVNLVMSVNSNLVPGYKYKEAFFQIGQNYCNVFAVEVSEEQALCFETNKDTKRPLYELAKEKGSMIAAIEEMAQKKRSA